MARTLKLWGRLTLGSAGWEQGRWGTQTSCLILGGSKAHLHLPASLSAFVNWG